MSRIEEALKRAASGERSEVLEPPKRWPGAVDAPLEHYSPEREPVRRDEAIDVPHSTVVVAPRTGRHHFVAPLDPEVEGKLVVSPSLPPVSAEQYLRIVAALDAAQAAGPLKTLMVCSALPGDGKTLTATNVALTLSESYARHVLLIDGDLRRPRVHEIFRLPNAIGLADALRSHRSPAGFIELSPHLTVLPAGHAGPNPMMGLASTRMKELLDEVSPRFDWVLLDSPPVGVIADAQLLARSADAVLLVIGAGSTPYKMVQRAISEIGAERIIGTVLNRVESDALPVSDYYHHYYSPRPR